MPPSTFVLDPDAKSIKGLLIIGFVLAVYDEVNAYDALIIPFNPLPLPIKDPVKDPVEYDDVNVLKDPVVTKEPVSANEPVPVGPGGPCGPGVTISTTLVIC